MNILTTMNMNEFFGDLIKAGGNLAMSFEILKDLLYF